MSINRRRTRRSLDTPHSSPTDPSPEIPLAGGNDLPKSPARASLDATLLSLLAAAAVAGVGVAVAAGTAHAAPGSDATPSRWPGVGVERVLDVRPGDDLTFTLASDTAGVVCRLHPATHGDDAAPTVYALLGSNGLYPDPTSAYEERATDDGPGFPGLPVILAPGEIGYVWRSDDPSPLFTRITPLALHDGSRRDELRRLLYLAADALGPGSHRLAPKSDAGPTAIPTARQRLVVVDPTVSGASIIVAYPVATDISLLLLQTTPVGYRIVDRARSGGGPAGRIGVELLNPMNQAVLVRWIDGNAPLEVEVTPLASGVSPADVSSTARATPSRGRSSEPGIVLGTGGWTRITDDDGEPDSYWGQIAGSTRALLKVLILDTDPGAIGAAAVEYRIQAAPYSMSRRAGLGFGATDDDFDTNLVIEVNGVEVYRAPVTAAANLGWHHCAVDPGLLRRGRNEIRFGVDGGDYVYLGLDFDSVHGRSGSIVGDSIDWTSLRPAYHVGPGEYMIRLMIRE